jgi:transcriptional regulator with XRE-family HTH domain
MSPWENTVDPYLPLFLLCTFSAQLNCAIMMKLSWFGFIQEEKVNTMALDGLSPGASVRSLPVDGNDVELGDNRSNCVDAKGPDKGVKSNGRSTGFGPRLKQALGDESVSDFAKRTGISSSAINKYIKEIAVPGIDKAQLISQHTGRTLAWLISGEEENPTFSSSEKINNWLALLLEALTDEQKAKIIATFQQHGVQGVFASVLSEED